MQFKTYLTASGNMELRHNPTNLPHAAPTKRPGIKSPLGT